MTDRCYVCNRLIQDNSEWLIIDNTRFCSESCKQYYIQVVDRND